MHLMKNFQKGGMGEVLKFVTPDRRRVANGLTSSGPKPAAYFEKIARFTQIPRFGPLGWLMEITSLAAR